MPVRDFPVLKKELESKLHACAGSRLRKLGVELSQDGVRLQGETATFYVKQLATHCVREVLPDVRLVNDIHVL